MRNFDQTLDISRKINQSRQAILYLVEIEEMLEGVDFDHPIDPGIEIAELIRKAKYRLIDLIQLTDPTFCRLGEDLLFTLDYNKRRQLTRDRCKRQAEEAREIIKERGEIPPKLSFFDNDDEFSDEIFSSDFSYYW